MRGGKGDCPVRPGQRLMPRPAHRCSLDQRNAGGASASTHSFFRSGAIRALRASGKRTRHGAARPECGVRARRAPRRTRGGGKGRVHVSPSPSSTAGPLWRLSRPEPAPPGPCQTGRRRRSRNRRQSLEYGPPIRLPPRFVQIQDLRSYALRVLCFPRVSGTQEAFIANGGSGCAHRFLRRGAIRALRASGKRTRHGAAGPECGVRARRAPRSAFKRGRGKGIASVRFGLGKRVDSDSFGGNGTSCAGSQFRLAVSGMEPLALDAL